MSEKLSHKAETHETLVALPTPEQAEPLRRGEKDPVKELEKARTQVAETVKVEAQPNPLESLNQSEKAARPAASSYINRELKQVTLRREIQHIQRNLPPVQRTLSKVIHQPAVRAVSEATGKTISRPSGLLGGGIVAFLGTTGYFYLAQHVGMAYNYFIVVLLLISGFALGLILELVVWMATASKRHNA
jgi:hypothetical protein